MRRLLILWSLWVAIPAWADYRKTPGTPFDLSELTSELKRVAPTLQGCDDEWGTVICRRETGDFTEAERAAMDAALAVHDPSVRAKRKAKRQSDRAAAEGKLKALGLTDAEIESLR